MFPFSATLFSLLILSDALTISPAENHLNASESQSLQFASPKEGSTQQKQVQYKQNEDELKQQAIHNEVGYSNYRSKRDSAEVEDDLKVDKRVRDFVGKRSHPEMYSSIPETFMGTPVDISDDDDYPLELVIVPTDSSLNAYDVDGTENMNKNLEQRFLNYRNKRLRDFVGKRSSGVDTEWWGSYDKRLRDFVGKRSDREVFEDLIDKRSRDFVGKRGDSAYDVDILNQKRLREFVGKRSGHEDIDNRVFSDGERHFIDHTDTYTDNVDKRPREFLGKRHEIDEHDDIEKRLRDFVGKRGLSFLGTPSRSFEKRHREFVGKRYGFETFRESKRAREFVGKRDPSEIFYENKRIREFIGKREDKRPRQFVGKRSILLDGKEDKIELAKKLRDFVGKRSEDEMYREDKRLRDFIGKRSEFRTDSAGMSALKRLRDFIGKRDYVHDLDSREIVKRIREFVGRR